MPRRKFARKPMEIIIYLDPDPDPEFPDYEWIAELLNPPKGFPVNSTMFFGRSGHEALMEMAKRFSRMGFLD